MSFLLRIDGVVQPYSPGAIRRTRASESVTAATPVAPVVAEVKDQSSHARMQYQNVSASLRQERAPVITARDIMSSPVFTVLETETVASLLSHFKKHRFRHIPVVDQENSIVGIVSDRDLIGIQDPEKILISSHMHKPVLITHPDTSIREIAKVLFEERIGCIPLVEGEIIVGMVTRSDILRAVMNLAPLELWS